MLGFIYCAFVSLVAAVIHQPAPQTPSFAIYLLDHPDNYGEPGSRVYGQREVSEFALESTPLISDADILSYDLRQHSMKLTKEALARIPRTPSLHGLPFVIVANGERIYLGIFNRGISSFASGCPTILVDRKAVYFVPYKEGQNPLPEAQTDDILVIDRGYPQSHFTHIAEPDPRSDPRIVKTLTELHKLKAADEWLVWQGIDMPVPPIRPRYVIQGHSSLMSQPLQPTNLDIAGIATNAMMQNAARIMAVDRAAPFQRSTAPARRGTKKQGNMMTMLARKTDLNSRPFLALNSRGAITPYPHGQARVSKWWHQGQMRPQKATIARTQ